MSIYGSLEGLENILLLFVQFLKNQWLVSRAIYYFFYVLRSVIFFKGQSVGKGIDVLIDVIFSWWWWCWISLLFTCLRYSLSVWNYVLHCITLVDNKNNSEKSTKQFFLHLALQTWKYFYDRLMDSIIRKSEIIAS